MRRHGPLLVAWAITIVVFALGFLIRAPGLSVLAQFVAFALAIVSAHRSDKQGVLRRTLLYRGTLGLLLLATATVVVTAGSTVASGDSGSRAIGLVTLATTNLVATVLAWRALTKPAPRRAASVGMFAVIIELIALVIDAGISITFDYKPDGFGAIALLGSFAATWAGALVCIAALVSFEHADTVNLPGARVVDP